MVDGVRSPNGVALRLDMFESSVFGPEAVFLSVGVGRYRVLLPGLGFVLTPDGVAYEIDLRTMLRDRGAAAP